jgi:hypothetical protein
VANFFLIDHSLRKSGGHHFDYVRCVARAANQAGFDTTIGTHRSLKRTPRTSAERLDQFGTVRRVFRRTTYQPDSYLAGLQHLTRSQHVTGLLNDVESNSWQRYSNVLKRFQHRRRREKFVRQFAVDCERFFRPATHSAGDHAFFTTVSELELMGLAVYLSNHPKTLETHWHLQFHYNLFDGRTPEYENQRATSQAVRACFLAALARLSYHSIHLYATSATLVDQYSRLGVGEFKELSYPISQEFASEQVKNRKPFDARGLATAIQVSETDNAAVSGDPEFGPGSFSGKTDSSSTHDGEMRTDDRLTNADHEFPKPLRFTCPGGVRREKGHASYLQPLVDDIWHSHLSTGNVQIVVQRPDRKWPVKKEKIDLEYPRDLPGSELSNSPIQYFSHPLNHREYVELIKSTDCGLLFYDSRVYFSRRAGVLGELLACGKPVIVPAGSWLAEQIQEPIYRHAEKLLRSSRVVRSFETNELNWSSRNVPMPGGVLSFDHARHPFEFSIERNSVENHVMLRFDWHWPSTAGVYCRIDVTQKDASGRVTGTSSKVLGFRELNRKVNSVFRLEPETASVDFSLTNAFHESTASVKGMEVHALEISPSDETTRESPLGSVGVIASDREDLANCIDEIVNHFDHYRETASAFSDPWFSRHDPSRTVDDLVSVHATAGQFLKRTA